MAMEKHGAVEPGKTPDLQGTFGADKQASDKAEARTRDKLADQDPKKRLADGVAEEPTT